MTDTICPNLDSPFIIYLSWNVKGITVIILLKRSKVFSHLKCFKADILFLQETHLFDRDHVRLKATWLGNVYH